MSIISIIALKIAGIAAVVALLMAGAQAGAETTGHTDDIRRYHSIGKGSLMVLVVAVVIAIAAA